MENVTMSNVTVAALVEKASQPVLNSPSVQGTSNTAGLFLLYFGAVLGLLILLYCALPFIGFIASGIAAGSYAAAWMSSIAIVNGVGVVAGSLFAILQAIAMGGIAMWSVLLVLAALIALAVGVYELCIWLLHLWNSGALHFPAWLVDLQWNSLFDHHKWKLYT